MPRQEWGFHYAGPVAAAPNMNCVTCRAAETKECPTHAKGYADGCAHCAAAKGTGPCQAHWGLKAALDFAGSNPAIIDVDSKGDFELAKELVLAETTKKPNVRVTMRGSGDLASTDEREIHIEMKAIR
jgi:hypothetical protein